MFNFAFVSFDVQDRFFSASQNSHKIFSPLRKRYILVNRLIGKYYWSGQTTGTCDRMITARIRSMGKVMFSEVSVYLCPSRVRGEGVCVWGVSVTYIYDSEWYPSYWNGSLFST